MSETGAEDMTPLTERKSINSSFLWRGVCDEGLQPSQQSEADVGAYTEKAHIITLYHKKKGGEEERKGVAWVRTADRRGQRKRDKKRETWTLREMDAEGVREFIVAGLVVPVHVRVHSWGKRGKWGTDVLYQTQRPELQ